MKNLAVLLFVFCVGGLNAQSSTQKEKTYQRYENGELVENKYYLEQDGRAIAGTDFEMPEFSMGSFNMDFEAKSAEMEQRMKEIQSKTNKMMATRMSDMNKRMEEMQARTKKMQMDMQRRMDKSMQDMQHSKKPIDQITPTNKPTFKIA